MTNEMIDFFLPTKLQGIEAIHPPNIGWLQYKLTTEEMDYVWRCIDRKKGNTKDQLAGNITSSYSLVDKSDWFWINVLKPLSLQYEKAFGNQAHRLPITQRHPFYLHNWWVNYQKQTEFNPCHSHSGVYSFVIWMKIPTDYEEQKKNPIALKTTSDDISNFRFEYSDIMGKTRGFTYRMSPKMEGTLVFFPSGLRHEVFPFYNCDEDRISVSGNILLNTARLL